MPFHLPYNATNLPLYGLKRGKILVATRKAGPYSTPHPRVMKFLIGPIELGSDFMNEAHQKSSW
jgi:hypothetical protein